MAIFNVTNATQLQSALASAAGGDRIVLAAGNYGQVSINNRQFVSNVTIQAASTGGVAHLDGLKINNSKNITVAGLDVGRGLTTGEPDYTQLNYVYDSTNIRFSNLSIHGSLDGNAQNDGVGLALRNVKGFSIADSTFTELWRGAVVVQSSNVSLQGNKLSMIRSDGAVVAATDGVVFDGNSFTDFRPNATLGDHADAIQFWNTGQTKGSSNITIKNNVIMPGYFSGLAGSGVQGIFISDPMSYGYKNVQIQNNVIYSNGAYHGISVYGATDLSIVGNTVVSNPNDSMRLWIAAGDSANVTVKDNVSDDLILQNNTGLFQDHNLNFAQSPTQRGLLPQLANPVDQKDLLLSGIGFKETAAPANAAVSSAISKNLADMLTQKSGAMVAQVALLDEPAPTLKLETALSAPQISAMPHLILDHPAVAPMLPMTHMDYFVALA